MAGDEEARARAILVEMQVRLSQGPHIALGIAELSTPEQVRAAFLGLTKQFHPARFGRMSSELQKMSNEVFLGIKSAHDSLMRTTGGRRASGTSGGVPTVSEAAGSAGIRQTQQIRATGQIPPLRPPAPTAAPGTQPPGRGINPSTQPPGRALNPATQPPGRPLTPVPPGTQPGVQPARPLTPTGRDRVGSSQQPPLRNTPPQGVALPRTQTPSRPPINRAATPPQRAQTPPGDPSMQRYGGTPSQPPANQQPLQRTAPVFDERAALNDALTLLNRREWTNARVALHALAARMPQERQYRALLCYARGREAFAAGRSDDAAMEFQRALQLDPSLAQAQQALSELKRR